ncbi:MAG: cysteine--tRNA ligase [bacterium]
MLKIYNTLTKSKEKFVPLNPPFVGIYVCGPTVYDNPHLGHAKSYVSFDVVVRFLRASGYKVRYVQNITDVGHLLGEGEGEDRVQKKARLEKLEPVEIAQKYERIYFIYMDLLNCLRPDISCRATGHIPEMIELVKTLLNKGYAYQTDENVYFDISKFKEYGKLTGRKVEDMLHGSRVKTAEDKKNTADFALWKKADDLHIMKWNSPWGEGYPGWHLECSVMSMKYIGPTLDIHGGGLDNQFPHHECEIAQSEAATGEQFVRYWMHNNMVTVEGQKMSKSLGNFITIEDLIKKYDPMTVRFFVLQGHYRSPQDFSDEALDAAQKGYQKLLRSIEKVRSLLKRENKKKVKLQGKWKEFKDQFFESMENDFNTAEAISVLFDLNKYINEKIADSSITDTELAYADHLYSVLSEDILGLSFEHHKQKDGQETELMGLIIDLRKEFRSQKNWEAADFIRDGLKNIGITLEDTKEGTIWRKE